MRKKQYSLIFKILSSILILYLLFTKISFSLKGFEEVLRKINISWLLLSLPIVIIVLGIKSYRWSTIISSEGYNYSNFKVLSAYLASYSLGVVTPGRLGELLKVYNLRKDFPNIDLIMAFRTVVLDRLFDMFFLVWFGLAGVIFYYELFGNVDTSIILTASFVVVFSGLTFGNLLFKLFLRKFVCKNKVLHFIQSCLVKMLTFSNIKAWLLTGLSYAIYFAGIQILFRAVNISINFLETGFIISLIGLTLLLPISVAGFGTREAGLVYLLSFYSIKPEIAISFSILQFITFFVWGGIIGLLFWIKVPLPLRMIKEDIRKLYYLIRKTNT